MYVYILTNRNHTVLYVGVTNDLAHRLSEHRNPHLVRNDGKICFTHKYKCTKLVYFEGPGDAIPAIEREKEIKRWTREKKRALINSINEKWEDLSLAWLSNSASQQN